MAAVAAPLAPATAMAPCSDLTTPLPALPSTSPSPQPARRNGPHNLLTRMPTEQAKPQPQPVISGAATPATTTATATNMTTTTITTAAVAAAAAASASATAAAAAVQSTQSAQPMAKTAPTTSSPLLRLPLELRTLIYAHLTPATPLSYPLGASTAVTWVSHRPPPRALLLTCRALAAEALDHFYRVARFGVLLNPPAPLADPHFQRLAHLPQLRRLRNLAVSLDWDMPPSRRGAGSPPPPPPREEEEEEEDLEEPGDGGGAGGGGGVGLPGVPLFRQVMLRGRCADMLRLAKRLVGVLDGAKDLRVVCVGWTDLVEGCWGEKKAVLDVLVGGLRARGIKVVRGDVVALDEGGVGRLFDAWDVVREDRR